MTANMMTDPAGVAAAYRAVLGDVMHTVTTAVNARKVAENRAGTLERQYRAAVEKRAQAENELTDTQALLQTAKEEISTLRAESKKKINELISELEESERLRLKSQELQERAVLERGEQSAKVVELQQALEEARSGQASPPADVAKIEAQLNATIGSLRKAEESTRAEQQRVVALEKENTELREANLELSEQASRVEDLEKALDDARNTAATPKVDVTALRSRVNSVNRFFREDEPEKMARAIGAVLQEMNRLEGGK